METEKMFNPILVYDGSQDEFNNLSIRKQCGHYAIHFARSLELFLEVLNKYPDEVQVEKTENQILTEIELHEQIAQYMRLSESFMGDKPE